MKEVRYFNFPVILLSGFLDDDRECLANIWSFSLYRKASEYLIDPPEGFEWVADDENPEKEAMRAADDFFGTITRNRSKRYMDGQELCDSLPDRLPMVMLKRGIYFDFYKNEKTEYDKICLLVFLGLKSIIGKKAFTRSNKNFVFSRALGEATQIDLNPSFGAIFKYYSSRYQWEKLIKELETNWGLKYYSFRLKGFYFSFVLDYEKLIYEAEKRRKSTLDKQLNFEKKETRKRVMAEMKKHAP